MLCRGVSLGIGRCSGISWGLAMILWDGNVLTSDEEGLARGQVRRDQGKVAASGHGRDGHGIAWFVGLVCP